MIDENEIPGLDAAKAKRAAALSARDVLQGRSNDAAAVVRGEEAKRSAIIKRIADGDETAPAEIMAADEAIHAAKSAAVALAEAVTKSNTAAERAEGEIAKVLYKAGNLAYIASATDHLAALEEGDELGKRLEAWLWRITKTEAQLWNDFGAAGRTNGEEIAMMNRHNDLIAMIPARMQNIIARNGSVVNYRIAEPWRSTLSRAILDARQRCGGEI